MSGITYNLRSEEFRDKLILSIKLYQEFDKLEIVSVGDVIDQFNNLIIVSSYKFKHSWGNMELVHDRYRDKPTSWLFDDLNRCMHAC